MVHVVGSLGTPQLKDAVRQNEHLCAVPVLLFVGGENVIN